MTLAAIQLVNTFLIFLLRAPQRNHVSSLGVLIDKAQDLIKKPALTDDDLMKLFNRTMQDAMSVGLTSIHDAGLDPMSLEFFKRQASVFEDYPREY